MIICDHPDLPGQPITIRDNQVGWYLQSGWVPRDPQPAEPEPPQWAAQETTVPDPGTEGDATGDADEPAAPAGPTKMKKGS